MQFLLNAEYLSFDNYIDVRRLLESSDWVNMIVQYNQPNHDTQYERIGFFSCEAGNQVPVSKMET